MLGGERGSVQDDGHDSRRELSNANHGTALDVETTAAPAIAARATRKTTGALPARTSQWAVIRGISDAMDRITVLAAALPSRP